MINIFFSSRQQLRQIAEFRRDNEKLVNGLMPEQEKIPFITGGAVNVLTDRDNKNRRILVVNSGKIWDPEVVSSDSLFRMFYLSKENSTSYSHENLMNFFYSPHCCSTREVMSNLRLCHRL
jgi:hypothetical protein